MKLVKDLQQHIRRAACVFAVALIACSVKGQSGTSIAGGAAATDQFAYSYTIGQIFYTSVSNMDYYISQGLQHPFIQVMNETQTNRTEFPAVEVYPNPTSNYLYIHIQTKEKLDYRIQLFDNNARIMTDKLLKSNAYELPFIAYKSGTYILKIFEGKKVLRSFIIVKN